MKIFNWLLEKLSQKLYENSSKWFFEKVGDVLIVQVPLPQNIPPQKQQEYLVYAKKHFELHLETLGVKEIITVANRK